MTPENLITIDSSMVGRMVTMLPRQTPEDVQACFGISLNTWMKLRKGQAIRRSVAARLMKRLEQSGTATCSL